MDSQLIVSLCSFTNDDAPDQSSCESWCAPMLRCWRNPVAWGIHTVVRDDSWPRWTAAWSSCDDCARPRRHRTRPWNRMDAEHIARVTREMRLSKMIFRHLRELWRCWQRLPCSSLSGWFWVREFYPRVRFQCQRRSFWFPWVFGKLSSFGAIDGRRDVSSSSDEAHGISRAEIWDEL